MRPADHHQHKQRVEDVGTPTLLLVSAIAVLAGVVAVVVAGASGTAWGVVLALAVVVAGLVAVSATMARQMDDRD
jgi:uncharacterized membrane protein YdjX (TVP38/TMEM64 family)